MKYMRYTLSLHTIALLMCIFATHSHAAVKSAALTRSISHRSISHRSIARRSMQNLDAQLAELGLPTESLDLEQFALTRRRQQGASLQELQQALATPSDRVMSESIRRTRLAVNKKKAAAGQKKMPKEDLKFVERAFEKETREFEKEKRHFMERVCKKAKSRARK